MYRLEPDLTPGICGGCCLQLAALDVKVFTASCYYAVCSFKCSCIVIVPFKIPSLDLIHFWSSLSALGKLVCLSVIIRGRKNILANSFLHVTPLPFFTVLQLYLQIVFNVVQFLLLLL